MPTFTQSDMDAVVEQVSELGDLSYLLAPDPNPVGIQQRLRVQSIKHLLNADPPPAVVVGPMPAVAFDSTTAADIPADAQVVMGYVDGDFAWSGRPEVPSGDWARFPNAKRITISAIGSNMADLWDREEGDLTAQAAAVDVQQYPGTGVYVSLANLAEAKTAVQNANEPFKALIAHWTNQAHICDKACLASNHLSLDLLDDVIILGTQYTAPETGSGGHYDKSLLTAAFLATV